MTDKVAGIIEEVVRSRLADAGITAVRVGARVLDEDDVVIPVTVVFARAGLIDAAKTAGLVRHIRHRLRMEGDTAFPILSFVSQAEAGRAKAEAA
ncbi:MAG: hypothetical protein IT548_05855 [Alphaproteobacteria bacterium]|nr:hypothetical protein [Alphaproteobacteria bacterium]